MAAPKKKKVIKRKAVKKRATPITSLTTIKPSKAKLLKSAKAGLQEAKTILVQAKRDLIEAQKMYLAVPTNVNAAAFRNIPGNIIRANRKVDMESKKVLRLS